MPNIKRIGFAVVLVMSIMMVVLNLWAYLADQQAQNLQWMIMGVFFAIGAAFNLRRPRQDKK